MVPLTHLFILNSTFPSNTFHAFTWPTLHYERLAFCNLSLINREISKEKFVGDRRKPGTSLVRHAKSPNGSRKHNEIVIPAPLEARAFEQWTHFLKFNNCYLPVQLSNQSPSPYKRNNFLLQILLTSIFRSLLSLGSLTTASRKKEIKYQFNSNNSFLATAISYELLYKYSTFSAIITCKKCKTGLWFCVVLFWFVCFFFRGSYSQYSTLAPTRRCHPNVLFVQNQIWD